MSRFIPKIFAENATDNVVFGSWWEQGGQIGDGTVSNDPATLQGNAAWPLGLGAATNNFFKLMRSEELNGVLRVLSSAIIQQFKDGLTFWQSEMPVTQYQTIVQYQTGSDLPKLYINITGTSTSTPPDSDTTNWKEMSLGGNTPFFFGWSQYFENAPYNASWLASNGQYNASSLYPDFWTQLTGVELNTSLNVGDTIEISGKTYVKRGLPVVLSTGTITDYDFVVNQNDQTFRLPLLNGEEDLPGTVYEDLTLSASGATYTASANGILVLTKTTASTGDKIVWLRNSTTGYSQMSHTAVHGNSISASIVLKKGQTGQYIYTADGVTSVFRFIPAVGNGTLYYYVGDTVQDASLINAGAVLGQLSNKVDIDASNFNADGRSYLSGIGMPSTRYDNVTLLASGQTYTAPANGYFSINMAATAVGQNCGIYLLDSSNNTVCGYYSNCFSASAAVCHTLPVKKGQTVKVNYTCATLNFFHFVYAEGEN